MPRLAFAFVLLALPLLGADTRLYLTDGTFHQVREYEVQTDRVRFYSTERRQWEEIPLELFDLERTEREVREAAEADQAEAEFWEREEAAERAQRREVASVPKENGAYWVDGGQMRPLPRAELDVETNKARAALKILSPVPFFSGKKIVWLAGAQAEVVVTSARPNFYFRPDLEERFGLIRLNTDKREGYRWVEDWEVLPVTNEVVEEHEDVEIFRREVADGLYQIWPEAPLDPGEYAIVEFSPGEANIRAWDFSYREEASAAGRQ